MAAPAIPSAMNREITTVLDLYQEGLATGAAAAAGRRADRGRRHPAAPGRPDRPTTGRLATQAGFVQCNTALPL